MAGKTITASVRLVDGLQVEARARNHFFVLDEPANIGGSDTGMTPMEGLLSSLGACMTIIAKLFAKSKGISLKDFRVELEGEGAPGVRPGFQDIRVKAFVKSDSPQEKIDEFMKFVERMCPVRDSIANGVRITASAEVVS